MLHVHETFHQIDEEAALAQIDSILPVVVDKVRQAGCHVQCGDSAIAIALRKHAEAEHVVLPGEENNVE